jgi:hypothetical protein
MKRPGLQYIENRIKAEKLILSMFQDESVPAKDRITDLHAIEDMCQNSIEVLTDEAQD